MPASSSAVAPSPGRPPAAVRRARTGHRVPALVVVVLCGLGIWALWRVFVVTRTGQLVEHAAFDGSRYGRSALWQLAEPVLELVSIPFIAAVLVGTMLLAVLRRRTALAAQVAVLMVGANVSTQVLKRVVVQRPDFEIGWYVGNTLPSGHTTAAASLAAALLFVAPPRLRPAAAVIGAGYAAATGISTMVGRWHRPSDVVAALLVVTAWVAVATALGTRPVARPGIQRQRDTHRATLVLLAGAVVSGTGAALALLRSLGALDGGFDSRGEFITAYGGGVLGVVAASCVAFAVMLLLRRAADPRPFG